jgi:hypothetical protein
LFPVARGEVRLCGAVISIDEATGRAVQITRVNELIGHSDASAPLPEWTDL